MAQCLEEDGLLIMARGLGLHKILLHFLRICCNNSKELVFVLNVGADEQQLFVEELLEAGIPPSALPKRINTEYTTNERCASKWFLLSITSQSQYVLRRRSTLFDLHNFGHGPLVQTHSCSSDSRISCSPSTQVCPGPFRDSLFSITDTCAEAFILRLFRQGNKVLKHTS